MATTIPSVIDITVLTQESSRDEIEEALGHVNATLKRTPQLDHLSRPNPDYARLHQFESYLLTMWQLAER